MLPHGSEMEPLILQSKCRGGPSNKNARIRPDLLVLAILPLTSEPAKHQEYGEKTYIYIYIYIYDTCAWTPNRILSNLL